MIAAIIGLQMGAFGVVMETVLSDISALPFTSFLAIMQPIHLAIGLVEGVVTASVISFVYTAKPEILLNAVAHRPIGTHPFRTIIFGFLLVSLLTGGVLSRFASERPDGLEWAITKVTGKEELKGRELAGQSMLASIQEKLAILPDYSFKKAPETKPAGKKAEDSKIGTSVSGLVGGTLTLGMAFIIGFILKRRSRTIGNAAKTC